MPMAVERQVYEVRRWSVRIRLINFHFYFWLLCEPTYVHIIFSNHIREQFQHIAVNYRSCRHSIAIYTTFTGTVSLRLWSALFTRFKLLVAKLLSKLLITNPKHMKLWLLKLKCHFVTSRSPLSLSLSLNLPPFFLQNKFELKLIKLKR